MSKARLQDSTCDLPSTAAGLEHRSHLHSVLPTLLQDTIDRADKWGDDGKIGRIDPFTEVYDVSVLGNVHFWGWC